MALPSAEGARPRVPGLAGLALELLELELEAVELEAVIVPGQASPTWGASSRARSASAGAISLVTMTETITPRPWRHS